MTDVLDRVRDHYRATGLTERLKTALIPFGTEDQRLAPEQLSALDQFHTRGLAATADLAKLADITADTAVLDIGSGIGGPARFLAATYGCRVKGVELSEPFVEAARYLTERTRQSGQVSFEIASALELPYVDGHFDLVWLQHVAMNISERAQLYREIRRVLKSGGRFATFDVVLNAKAWFAPLRSSGPPPSPNLSVVMGSDFPQLAANLGRSLMEGRVSILTAVLEAAAI
jgi:sarcosine/dimethylglycine N-methyltransferase